MSGGDARPDLGPSPTNRPSSPTSPPTWVPRARHPPDAGPPAPSTPDELAAVAVAYVQFALEHPALFRAMFAEPCDPTSEERVATTATISEYVRTIVAATFPDGDADALSTTVWALVHGLAFLHLDGKLDSSTPEIVAAQVTSAVHALFHAAAAMSGTVATAQPGA